MVHVFFLASFLTQAMKVVDETNDAVVFDVSLLDDFLEAAVKRGAFDHVRSANPPA